MKNLLLICIVFAAFPAESGIIEIFNRPIRVLNPGSEIFVTMEGDLRSGTTYQNGHSLLIGMPPFDDRKPFCTVEEISKVPDLADRKTALKLRQIEGFAIDNKNPDSWDKFVTELDFVSGKSYVTIKCFTEAISQYREITLGEFEQTFGNHLRFGNLSLGDPGIELRNPLYGEYDVLTPEVLRKFIQLKVLEPITLKKDAQNNVLKVTLIGGKQKDQEFSAPYCELLQIGDPNEVLPSELILPVGLQLRFSEDITGSYHKDGTFSHGFILRADLSGYNKPLKLYCSSNDSNRPLRYLEARYITHPILDWYYSF